MRRRTRVGALGAPPPELLTYTGSTWLQARTWLAARADWWDATHEDDVDEVGVLEWLFAGLEQVPSAPFCGSVSGSCRGDARDCCCSDPIDRTA